MGRAERRRRDDVRSGVVQEDRQDVERLVWRRDRIREYGLGLSEQFRLLLQELVVDVACARREVVHRNGLQNVTGIWLACSWAAI